MRFFRQVPSGSRRRVGAFMAIALAATFSVAHAQGVHVALVPKEQSVDPGSNFSVELVSTQPGSSFNGYTAVVSYDPAKVTFLPSDPTQLQEGSYMIGACGNTFHHFEAAGDSIKFTDVLLCNQTFLPGPGQLYKLNFKASMNTGVAFVRIRSSEFYHGGVYVTPVSTDDAAIGIGVVLGVGDRAGVLHPRLSCAPNPFRGETVLRIETPALENESLRVVDMQGRVVRHLQSGMFEAGTRTVAWNGQDDAGRHMAAGLYFVRLIRTGLTLQTRVTLLH
jgi:hypothetical protein